MVILFQNFRKVKKPQKVITEEKIETPKESLTKENTIPQNEVKVDLNDYLGDSNNEIDWNYTELSDDDCEILASKGVYYSKSNEAWVKDR